MQPPSGQNAVGDWAFIAVVAVAWLAVGSGALEHARSHDFLSFYTGAYMTSHGELARLYDPDAQLAVERQLAPSTVELVPFVRPPFYALILAPLGWLPLGTAFVCWILLQAGVLIACLRWGWQRFGTTAVVFGALSMPAALGIAHGQDCALFLAVLIASYSLAEERREWTAGMMLGLLLVKFHLVLLWPLALIAQRRWKMLAGFAATGAVTAGISLAMIGVEGARAYVRLLQNPDLPALSPAPEFMIGLPGLGANFGLSSNFAYAAAVAPIAILLLVAVWRAPWWRVYAASTAASLLVAPHVYGYDAALLLLGLWLTVFRAGLQPTRMVALWLFTPLPFGFTLLGKPWAAVSSLSLLALTAALAAEAVLGELAQKQNLRNMAIVHE
jgi:hypothetical protein